MAQYTEADMQNALADIRNGVAKATAAARHGIPRTTLRNRVSGSQHHKTAHSNMQRLSTEQEKRLANWILQQEALNYAPTHAQVRVIATDVLKRAGDDEPLGKKWTTHFLNRHPELKTKLGRRTDWERINAATPENITRLFNLYETVSWIPPHRRYNADEGGIMEGQGINGLVIGSSEQNPNTVPIKTTNTRTWTSIVECISAVGVALDPLIIFKAKSIQDQWFKREFLAQHPSWEVTFSENGWTSNDIAVEWLEKVFLPQTQTGNPDDARLLIVDGHGSHTSDKFMTICYLNNVYLLFLPAHTSHVLQPLDLGCFSSLKAAYRRQIGEFNTLTDETKIGKAKFLEFYSKARQIGLNKTNIQSGWRATGLYPKNVNKPLRSRWVVTPRPKTPPPPLDSNIATPKRGCDLLRLLAEKKRSPTSRLSVRKAALALDRVAIEMTLRDREIERLQTLLDRAHPPKRRKVTQNPNERFINLAQILAQANQEPGQRVRKTKNATPEADKEDSSESEDSEPIRRTGRDRRPTQRYLERDMSTNRDSD
jgi:hypothetical protein